MTGTDRSAHISREELIGLAHDELADAEIGRVLAHMATCDECAARSAAVGRLNSFWEEWREGQGPAPNPWVEIARDVRAALARDFAGAAEAIRTRGKAAFLAMFAFPDLVRVRGAAPAPTRGALTEVVSLAPGAGFPLASAECRESGQVCSVILRGWPEKTPRPVLLRVPAGAGDPVSLEWVHEGDAWVAKTPRSPARFALVFVTPDQPAES